MDELLKTGIQIPFRQGDGNRHPYSLGGCGALGPAQCSSESGPGDSMLAEVTGETKAVCVKPWESGLQPVPREGLLTLLQ